MWKTDVDCALLFETTKPITLIVLIFLTPSLSLSLAFSFFFPQERCASSIFFFFLSSLPKPPGFLHLLYLLAGVLVNGLFLPAPSTSTIPHPISAPRRSRMSEYKRSALHRRSLGKIKRKKQIIINTPRMFFIARARTLFIPSWGCSLPLFSPAFTLASWRSPSNAH